MSDASEPVERPLADPIAPPARFQPGGDGAPPPALPPAPPAWRFAPAADAQGSDHDILLGYQLFLGRDPESSFVIAEARTTQVRGFMRGLLTSDEFGHGVLAPLEAGRPVPHERQSAGPDEEQIAWLLRHLVLEAEDAAALSRAGDWRAFLTLLSGTPGFPRAASAAPKADMLGAPGFVLITLEQPRGGEPLTGGRVEGSGWVIAPSEVAEVSVLSGEHVLTQARFGLPRPDVARRFPHYREAGRSGFAFSAGLPAAMAAQAELLTIAVRTVGGEMARKSVRIQLPGAAPGGTKAWAKAGAKAGANGSAPRAPEVVQETTAADLLVRIDRPAPAGGSVRLAARQPLALGGWAVARGGVASVHVHLDGEDLGEAQRGIRREDIAESFADFEGALLSGWAMVLPAAAMSPGSHRLRIVASDASGALADTAMALWVEAEGAQPVGALRRTMPAQEAGFARRLLAAQERPAFFTVLIRADGDAPLADTLESLERQAMPDWRAVIVGGETALEAARALQVVARLKERLVFSTQAGLAAGWGDGVPEGASAMVCALRAGDVLGCDALLEFAVAAAMRPEAGLFYADERRGGRPMFKPDFAPEQLLGMNYIGRAWWASAALLAKAGLAAGPLAASSDYDAVLLLTEAAGQAVHVPHVLMERGPAADARQQEAAALAAAADRRGLRAELYAGPAEGVWNLRRVMAAADLPAVSIIMPTCGAGDLVRQAIASIKASLGRSASAPRVEIVVVDDLPAKAKALRSWIRKQADVTVRAEGPFNWSRFNNQGAKAASGGMLLFLNDDIEATAPGWLEAMLEQAMRPEVGAVGALLTYPGGRVQHAGLYLDGAVGRHAFRFHAAAEPGPFGMALVTREVAGVTGACMMIRRDIFDRLGGFDEAHGIVNNDLDFCLRARAAGLDVIYTPHARLLHHELASRANLADSFDAAGFAERFRTVLPKGDPFRNPQLAADDDQYAADPEPVALIYAGKQGGPRQAVRRILAVKLDHIGDFVTALPALHVLKARFPGARLTLLAAPASLALTDLAPVVDEVIPFTFFESRSADGRSAVGEEALVALAATLVPQRFDLAIDLRMHPDTRPVLRHSGAALLAGYDHEGRFPWLDVALEWEGDTRLLNKRSHIAERLVQLAEAASSAFAPAMPVMGAGLETPEAVLAMLPEGFADRRIACVHPGVGNPMRRWPAASFAALIDLLVADGMAVVLVGTAGEASLAGEVLGLVGAGAPVCSLAGQLSLSALPALLKRCSLFVGNDSGPKHLAGSLGVPSVGVHSGVVDAREWGPLGHASVAVQKQMSCGPCYIAFAEECPRALACLTGLHPREIYAACLRVMAAGPAPPDGGEDEVTVPGDARMPESVAPSGPTAALLGSVLAEAKALASRPLQPAGAPQGYIETIATDAGGVVWFVGWMRKGHALEFAGVIAAERQHAVAAGLMEYPRSDLPADAHGVIGILAGGWEPACGADGALEPFMLFFGREGQHHVRCHMPLRRLTVSKLAGEYRDLLERGRAMRQAPSLQRLLGSLENWEPTRPGAAWLGTEASVDRVLLVPGLGCMVEGWVMSPLRRIDTLRLRVGGVTMTLVPQTLGWKPRQDLAEAYPGSAAMAGRAGFTGLFEATEEPADFAEPVLKLVFEGGASVNAAIQPRTFRRLGQSARLEEARVYFPALEEEAFFPRFAAATVQAERALMAPPQMVQSAPAGSLLVFGLPAERCDLFLLFEEVARHCRGYGSAGFGGVLFLGTAGSGRSDALWMLREFTRDLPGLAASLAMIDDQALALAQLPQILAMLGAERFLFVAAGSFLTAAGWQAVPPLLAGPPTLTCFTGADRAPGARGFAWSAAAFAQWSKTALVFLGGFHGDNGLGAEGPGIVADALRSSRPENRNRLQDAVNRALAEPPP